MVRTIKKSAKDAAQTETQTQTEKNNQADKTRRRSGRARRGDIQMTQIKRTKSKLRESGDGGKA